MWKGSSSTLESFRRCDGEEEEEEDTEDEAEEGDHGALATTSIHGQESLHCEYKCVGG